MKVYGTRFQGLKQKNYGVPYNSDKEIVRKRQMQMSASWRMAEETKALSNIAEWSQKRDVRR